jgi:hypothetical protein
MVKIGAVECLTLQSNQMIAAVADLVPVVKNEPVCNIDETSWRQVGASKRSRLWPVVTAQVTLFRIAPRRSSQVARQLLDGRYEGVAGTDWCSSYTWPEQRQLC